MASRNATLSAMAELVLVKAEDCLPLRQSVLRPGLPEKESVYPNDNNDRSTHYAMRHRKQTLGVISMLHEPRGDVGSEMYRIRGLAVLPEHQRQGLGTTLLKTIQTIATKRGGGLWANVRESAVPFYARAGFVAEGEEFDLKGIGAHRLMTWRPAP